MDSHLMPRILSLDLIQILIRLKLNITISEDYLTQSFPYRQCCRKNRFAGANFSDLEGSDSLGMKKEAEIELNFNEDGLSSLAKNADGSFVDSSLGFSLSANLNDTVLSKDIEGGLNKEIYNVAQFGGDKFTLE